MKRERRDKKATTTKYTLAREEQKKKKKCGANVFKGRFWLTHWLCALSHPKEEDIEPSTEYDTVQAVAAKKKKQYEILATQN